MTYMSLDQLEALPVDVLIAEQIAPSLKFSAATVRDLARDNALGFPVICYGGEVRIPKMPFIKFMRGEAK